ncbi:Uric acid degradation bifunctional protein PucL [Methylobacterium cerastii]|uniref:2-oxo-4-hydroxy-4-carboxy-5-ureidoimidazoline decarboxylase n=2 Tax=Methylobacterium TaxID=407 RepID=A0ABQ4QFJ0_9HYPH|nr:MULTISPECIES: 2-oxo-4-hydroxy-4-carboxy-5-ureidoimidazoline decarboxylase [Methylobacterium]TXM58424.1 2-oxo-4-hydroxy-4-carboxy-5-ureidoimidazoline decarboxylase [Methylobacterium sp. WL120]TXN81672.1 2-oxo-4-hydroxy-4-carboxy-5-ureidoimidazoline decarboxylase [Methylobacterium sp. WL8]GJD44024.1 Uric acid degradation bifunctional protein PucL [Methylobacterium cerastii]
MPDIAAVDALDRDGFVALLAATFEHAPWVAERAYAARPFASVAALHAAMVAVVRAAPAAERLAFLNGHPELAGAAARARQMTADSVAEQGSAGLDALTVADFDRFDRLNAAYREKFGFPFIIAVRGRSREAILEVFEQRLARDADTEAEAALSEIATITRMRLDRIVGSAG